MSIKHLYEDERPTLLLDFANSKTLDPRITVTRQSTATYVDDMGIIRTAAAGVGRIDHDPATGDCLGLLIEETRYNDILNSQVFTSGYNKSGLNTITQNTTVTTPEGLTDGVGVITESSGGTVHQFYEASSAQVTGRRTYSIFVKPNGRNYCVLMTSSFTHDLANGTTLGSASGEYESATTTKFSSGWVRCTVTVNHSNSYDQFNFKLAKDGHQDYSYSGDGSSGVYVWGAQLEVGPYPTSYIPTSGSSVTRNDDLVKIPAADLDFYNEPSGTVICNAAFVGTYNNASLKTFWSFGGANGNSQYGLKLVGYGFNNRLRTIDYVNTISGVYPGQAYTLTDLNSTAVAYGPEDHQLVVNGSAPANSTLTTGSGWYGPTGANVLDIGNYGNIVNSIRIRRFAYYNTRLSNTALEALTK